MARQAREVSKSGNYYVSLRGNELYVTDADKTRFAEIAAEKFEGGKVYGLEITKTEIRMAVKEPPKGISMAVKSLTSAPEPKKTETPKKTAAKTVKKTETAKKSASTKEPETEKKPEPKKNLPSWLL